MCFRNFWVDLENFEWFRNFRLWNSGLRDSGLRNFGLRNFGLRDFGLRNFGMQNFGLRSCGLRNFGILKLLIAKLGLRKNVFSKKDFENTISQKEFRNYLISKFSRKSKYFLSYTREKVPSIQLWSRKEPFLVISKMWQNGDCKTQNLMIAKLRQNFELA